MTEVVGRRSAESAKAIFPRPPLTNQPVNKIPPSVIRGVSPCLMLRATVGIPCHSSSKHGSLGVGPSNHMDGNILGRWVGGLHVGVGPSNHMGGNILGRWVGGLHVGVGPSNHMGGNILGRWVGGLHVGVGPSNHMDGNILGR